MTRAIPVARPAALRSAILGLGVAASGLTSVVPVAEAQIAQSPLSNEMRAEYLFRQGEKKFDSGQYQEACNDFAESLRLGPKLGTLLNLALCHETIGKPATAWREYHHGAAWASQNSQKDRHDFALQHALALETKLPRVLLQLPADRAIGSVEVDGEPLPDSQWYLPVFLDPGEHAVTISAPGKQRSSVKFRVISSPTEQLVNVPALIDDVGGPAPPPKAQPVTASDPDATRRLAGLVTMGAGAVTLLVGVTFAVLAIDKRDDIGDRCRGTRCTPEGADVYRAAQNRATVSTVATILGVAAGGVGGWLYFTSRPPQKGEAPRPAVGVRGTPGGAQVGFGGAF